MSEDMEASATSSTSTEDERLSRLVRMNLTLVDESELEQLFNDYDNNDVFDTSSSDVFDESKDDKFDDPEWQLLWKRDKLKLAAAAKDSRKVFEQKMIKKLPKPIDFEMDVPLGVYVALKPSYILDSNNIYLRCGDLSNWCVPQRVDIRQLDRLKMSKIPLSSLKLGDYVSVTYGGDSLNDPGRYRGSIERLPEDDDIIRTVSIKLIDIGRIEEFDLDKIFELPNKFYDQKRLCFRFGMRRFNQVIHPEAIAGVKEYLHHVFDSYNIIVRVDVVLRSETFPTSETNRFGEIHCCSGEVSVTDDLIFQGFIKAKSEPESLRTLCKDTIPVPAYVKHYDEFEKLTGSVLRIERAILQYTDNHGLTAYCPWMIEGQGDLCLVKNPKTRDWSRGQVIYIKGRKAWVALVDSGQTVLADMAQLKAASKGLRHFLASRNFKLF